jgi:cellulose biosynthesis protein BcsQ
MVIGIAVRPDDHASLSRLGIDHVIESRGDAQELLAQLAGIVQQSVDPPGVWNLEIAAEVVSQTAPNGRLIAVWGPAGAPGRTTTAVLLARALSQRGRTAVIDADLAAPSVAFTLGLAEDLSGLIIACRHAEAGSLSSRTLLSSMSSLSNDYCALTGITSSRRWPEIRPAALGRVLDQVVSDFRYAVVDVGSAFGGAEPLMPSHTSASDAVLQRAEVILAVCQAEPLAVARFLGDLPDLAAFGVPITAILTGGTMREQADRLIRESASRLRLSMALAELALDVDSLARAIRRGAEPTVGRRRLAKFRPITRLVELVA